MAGVKMSAYFSQGRAGWSETHYGTETFGALDFTAWTNNYVSLRRPLLAGNVKIDAVKFSDWENPRKTFVKGVDLTGPFTTSTPGTANADMPFTAVLVKMNLLGGGSRRIFLRGLQDSLTVANNGKIVNGTWLSQFAAFAEYIVTNAYAGQTKIGAGNLSGPVLDVQANAEGIRVWGLIGALTEGERVQITGTNTLPAINGSWRIHDPGLGGVVTLVGSQKGGTLTHLPGGTIRTQRTVLDDIVSCEQIRFTSKRVGRPFGLLRSRRGKRRAVAS